MQHQTALPVAQPVPVDQDVLDRPQGRLFRSDSGESGMFDACMHCERNVNEGTTCFKHAMKTFVRTFGIAYGLRTALTITLRAFQLMRKGPRALFSIDALFGEHEVVVRTEAVRLGFFAGVFTGGFEALHCALRRNRRKDDGWNAAIAGAVAGLSLLFQTADSRRTIALYICARLLQCVYNAGKLRGYYKAFEHGDSLLFILSSAQVMYAYVMRPETIPASYFSFIKRTGPIDGVILDAVRANCRGQPFARHTVEEYLKKFAGSDGLIRGQTLAQIIGPSDLPAVVPCSVLHPMQPWCSLNAVRVLVAVLQKILPLYMSLTFLPLVLFNFWKMLRHPLVHIGRGLLSCARSMVFLASFTSLYQQTVCLSRKLSSVDHKITYWVAGVVSSLSIFIERKSRRSELALYTAPRAADSLFMLLQDRHLLTGFAYGEVVLFCLSAGGIMYFLHHEPQTMSPLLKSIFHFLFSTTTHLGLHRHDSKPLLSAMPEASMASSQQPHSHSAANMPSSTPSASLPLLHPRSQAGVPIGVTGVTGGGRMQPPSPSTSPDAYFLPTTMSPPPTSYTTLSSYRSTGQMSESDVTPYAPARNQPGATPVEAAGDAADAGEDESADTEVAVDAEVDEADEADVIDSEHSGSNGESSIVILEPADDEEVLDSSPVSPVPPSQGKPTAVGKSSDRSAPTTPSAAPLAASGLPSAGGRRRKGRK